MRCFSSLPVPLLALTLLTLAGCGEDGGGENNGHPTSDAGEGEGEGQVADTGPDLPDGGADVGPDGGEEPRPDGGSGDAGPQDAGPGEPDLYFPDLGSLDSGLVGCQLHGCPGAQTCDAQGNCQEPPVCAADLDCQAGRICVAGGCDEPCRLDEECAGSTWCHVPSGRCRAAGECDESAACLPGDVCRGEPGRCVAAPTPACDEAHPCPGGLRCGAYGACEEPWRCSAEGGCLPGRVCDDQGRCVQCRSEEDCTGTQTCQVGEAGGVCVEPVPCVAAEDCLAGRSCSVEGSCVANEACLADAFEPDEGPGGSPLLPARLFDRTLCPGDAFDVQRFLVPAGSALEVTVRATGGAPTLDPRLTLRDAASGRLLAVADQPGAQEVAVLPLATVDTLIEAKVQAPVTQQGSYLLSARTVEGPLCADDEGETHGGDDLRDQARPVAAGRVDGALCGADVDWLQLTVPAGGASLAARLDGSRMTGEPSLALYLDAGAPVLQGTELVRENLAAGEIWVRVSGGEGPYGLLLSLTAAAETARCSGATALLPGIASAGLLSASGLSVNSCSVGGAAADPATLPDAAYSFVLNEAAAVELALEESSDPTATLALRALCGAAASELGCVSGTTSLHLPVLAAGRYTVLVEGAASDPGASFKVRLSTTPPAVVPPNDLCPAARPILLANGAATVSGNLALASDELQLARCGEPTGLPEIYYTITLDAPSLLTFTSEGETSPYLTLVRSCAAPVELGCAAPGRPLLVNDLPAGDYVLVAQGLPAAGSDGGFVIRATRSDVAGPDQCLGAREIGTGGVFNDVTAGRSKYDMSRDGCTLALVQGPDMPFRVHMNAGQTLRATLQAEWDGALYLVQDCEAEEATCVVGADRVPGGQDETVEYTAEAAGDFFLIVDAYSRTTEGPFRLLAAVDGECLVHGDCAAGARCTGFRCVLPQCALATDCPLAGSRCVDEQCVAPDCLDDETCLERGQFCVDHVCRLPDGDGFGSGLLLLPIPDDDPAGLLSSIEAPELGALTGVAVQLELEHPYQGDLVVTLVSPAGTEVRLHNQTGGDQPFGPVVYGLTRAPDGPGQLLDLVGEDAAGPWLLEVQDLSAGDAGRLLDWALWLSWADAQ